MILLLLFIIPLIAAALSYMLEPRRQTVAWLGIVATVAEGIVAAQLVAHVVTTGTYQFTEYFALDALGVIVILVTALVGIVSALYAFGYFQVEMQKGIVGFRRVRQFYLLFHLFLLAMFVASATRNLMLMWVAIEATTLSTAFLISFYNKPSATEAAWKYLIINSVGLLISFFGTILFLAVATLANPVLIKIAFVLVLIGYGTKIGLVPLHTWKPDAYDKAPVPVVAVLSSALLNVVFLALIRFKNITDAVVGADFSSQLLVVFGVLSVVVAALLIVIQSNYKRLLAYSTIEHAGLIALGLGFGGIGVAAALWHMIFHTLTKTLLFFAAGNIFLKYSSANIEHVRNLIKILPITTVLLMAGTLAIVGLPPFGIFVTEFSILAAGVAPYPVAVVVVALSLSVVGAGFIRHIVTMVFGPTPSSLVPGEVNIFTVMAPVVILILLVGLSGYIPAWFNVLITAAAAAH